MRVARFLVALGLLVMGGFALFPVEGAAELPPRAEQAIARAVAHPDRPPADREHDARRRPAEILAFAGIAPGMWVADLMAGSGWYTELLSWVVGPEGRVFAQNSRVVRDRYGVDLRLRVLRPIPMRWFRKPRLRNVTLVPNELETLEDLPEGRLDAALMVLFYHDTYWMGVDRKAMLARIHDSLRPGGVFLVIDHAAAPGRGGDDAERLHRVEEAQVVSELLAAGFALDARSDLLRNPDDDHQVSVFQEQIRGHTDRFVLRFLKPAAH